MKYLGLLRLQDQYIQIGVALASGIYLDIREWWIIWWVIATTFISCASFIVNELTDRNDTDRYSASSSHIKRSTRFDWRVVHLIFWGFSVLGFLISWSIGLLPWALAMWFWAVFYSLKPVRFKAVFGLDIAAQLAAWWLMPFLGPISLSGKLAEVWLPVIILACINWSIFFPYELADFTADRKAKLMATHVVLGMRNSLIFGMVLGVFGTVMYFLFGIAVTMPYTIPVVILAILVQFLYWRWLKLSSVKLQKQSLRRAVLWVKPYTQLLVPFILIWWIKE